MLYLSSAPLKSKIFLQISIQIYDDSTICFELILSLSFVCVCVCVKSHFSPKDPSFL